MPHLRWVAQFRDNVLSMIHKLRDHSLGNLADLGPMASEMVFQDEWVQFRLVIGYTITVFAGILGNWLSNHVIMKYKKAHTATSLFVVNISVTNMMLALLSSPFSVVSWVLKRVTLDTGHEGDPGHKP